jgi:7 transmembrane helices usually fused to an inactive transglutaminase/Transglutaminase-like superfamily
MNPRSLSNIAIAGFVLLGALCVGLRYRSICRDEAAREETQWEINYSAHFEPTVATSQQESQVRLAVPFDTRHCQVIRGRESWFIANPNVHAKITRPSNGTGNRMLVFSTRKAGSAPYVATAKFVVRLNPRPDTDRAPLESLTSRDRFLRPEVELPTTDPVVRQAAQLAPNDAQTEFERLQWIFEYCSDIDSSGKELTDDAKVAIVTKHGSPKARARAMVTLCRALGFPSRLIAGFIVRQGSELQPHIWLEVFQNQQWEPFDPTHGYSLNMPMNYVPVRRDSDQVFSTANVDRSKLAISYSIKRLAPDPRLVHAELRHPTQVFNLQRLPFKMHKVMKILLLLPFAALITTFLRNVVGLGTFGTFSPALLAMSFIYADWKTGLAILVIVITVGLLARTALERLRLLTVPRLSIILTIVILCVVFGISVLHYLVPAISAEVVLLPMIILSMLIERFHVSAEEDGLMHTIQLAAGTLVVAILCYMILGSERVGELVLTYPEMHFFTIAVFIGLGRYAGYRLNELWRFRDLIEVREAA